MVLVLAFFCRLLVESYCGLAQSRARPRRGAKVCKLVCRTVCCTQRRECPLRGRRRQPRRGAGAGARSLPPCSPPHHTHHASNNEAQKQGSILPTPSPLKTLRQTEKSGPTVVWVTPTGGRPGQSWFSSVASHGRPTSQRWVLSPAAAGRSGYNPPPPLQPDASHPITPW